MKITQLIALADSIDTHIPGAFDKREVIAASHEIACRIAGNDTPDRHDYQNAIPEFLKSLPNNLELAQSEIAIMASRTLGVPGIADEHQRLQSAREKLGDLQAEVAEAEAKQGQRLGRIAQLERIIFDESQKLEGWKIDFEGLAAKADEDILTYWATGTPVVRPFEVHSMIPVLERLAPVAIAGINAKIEAAEKELAILRPQVAQEPAAKPIRGKGIQSKPEPENVESEAPAFT